jgi:hypothetical protein
MVVALTPARPLWPAQTCLAKLECHWPANKILSRARTVYSVYAHRAHAFSPALAALPAGTKTLGFVTFDDPEASLWKPFGSHKVEHVLKHDTPEELRQRGIGCVLLQAEKLKMLFHQSLEEWLTQNDGKILSTISLTLRAGQPPADWLLVRMRARENP